MLKRLIIVPPGIIADLNSEYMDLLELLLEPFSCRAGTVILRQGKPAEHIYLIVKGKVEVSYKPYDGTPITISILDKDGIFGWSAVVGSSEYTSSATAIEDMEGFRLKGSELRKFCNEHPQEGRDVLEKLATAVSGRWQNAHEQVKSMLMHGMNI